MTEWKVRLSISGMTNARVREILEGVAVGRIPPADAARLIDEAKAGRGHARATTETPDLPTVDRLRVRATSARVRLVADPTVITVDVQGPHALRREGSTLVLTSEGERFIADDAFVLLTSGRWRGGAARLPFGNELRVRVRPDLAVDAEVIAGSLATEGLQQLERVRVTAGSAKVRGSNGPMDVLVQAGSANVEFAPTAGHSRVRCESGSVQLRLLRDSDVRVTTDSQLGRVVVEPPVNEPTFVLGRGAAELDIEMVMGHAVVKVDR